MPSIRAVLEARRKAAAVRVEELEAELAWVRADLAHSEEVLRRRVIGLEQYLEALAEDEAREVVARGAPRSRSDLGQTEPIDDVRPVRSAPLPIRCVLRH